MRREPGGEILIARAHPGDLTAHEHASVGLCPWRDRSADLSLFFPTATAVREETVILSRNRLEAARLLGRPLTGEENALKVYRILNNDRLLGSIVGRRMRGESGVIELLLAVRAGGRVEGGKIQRLREPDPVAAALRSEAWLGAFRGKSAGSDWSLGSGIPQAPPAARASAAAIVDAARTLLVLLAVADSHPSASGGSR